jgi:hypothetical protein
MRKDVTGFKIISHFQAMASCGPFLVAGPLAFGGAGYE